MNGAGGDSIAFPGLNKPNSNALGDTRRTFDTVVIDCTSEGPLVAPLARTVVGEAFAFAGLAPTMLDSISPEQHLAEKLHAICRDRGTRQNNRVKDLYDVVDLLQQGVTAEAAVEAVREVFRLADNTDLVRLKAPVPEGRRDTCDSMARENHLAVDLIWPLRDTGHRW